MRSRSRPRLAAVLAAAVLAGGASGAGVVVALDRGAQAAGPTIVQERAPANGSASAGSTEAAARQVLPSVVQVRSGRGGGSGVVMDGEGHVLTNHHVVSGASSVRLVLSSGRTLTAEVVGSDADDDIAVLRADAGALRAVRLGVSADLRIGQPVIAAGSPLGLNGTVTSGVVSALDRRASARSSRAAELGIGSVLECCLWSVAARRRTAAGGLWMYFRVTSPLTWSAGSKNVPISRSLPSRHSRVLR